MNCDFIDLKQETIGCNGVNLENLFLSLVSNSSFEKIRTIPINLIQLHYFDDVINEFN